MSEKALLAAMQHIKKVYLRKDPQLSDAQAECMAKDAVASIDWDNPALMHKDLTWIANDIYNRRFA